MKQSVTQIADAVNNKKRVAAAFGLFVDLVEQAAMADGSVDLCTSAGAELLGIFQREMEHVDEELATLLRGYGVPV